MTVEELIEELQTHPGELEVHNSNGPVESVLEGLYFEDNDSVTPAMEYDGEDVDDAEPCIILET